MDSREIHRRLRAAAAQFGIDTVPEYDPSSRRWEWEWSDGPVPAAVAAVLGEAAGRVRLHRWPSPRTTALAVITSSLTGQPTHELQVDDAAVDERTAAMAEALAAAMGGTLDAAEPYRVRERLEGLGGLPALLHPYTGPAPSMTPIEHLTHRYAVRVGGLAAVEAWRQRLAVLDPSAAVEAALADADADRATRLAVVALLGDLRRALEAQERAAMDRAMELDDVSYTDLGRALGVARQVAHRRHQARAADRPVRLSPQR